MGNHDGLLLRFSGCPLCLVTARHQNRVVDCGSKLDRTDDDRGDKRKLCPCETRNAHVDKDCKLDDQDQEHRQTERFENEENDNKNQSDRRPVDDPEIVVRDPD